MSETEERESKSAQYRKDNLGKNAVSLPTEQEQSVAMNPNSLLQLAVQNNADIDKLERLMDLQERWEKKEAEKAFYQAMTAFQEVKPTITKTSKGHNSNYAKLPHIQKIIDPVLSQFGLSYSWDQKEEVIDKQSKFTIICIARHVDGHTQKTDLSSFSDLSGNKSAIHGIASTVSYLCRYTLKNAFGLSEDDDDDGQGSGKKEQEPKKLEGERWDSFQENFKAGKIPPHSLDKTREVFDLTDEQKKWIQDNRPAPTAEQWSAIQKSFEQGDIDQEGIEQSYKLSNEHEEWIKKKS